MTKRKHALTLCLLAVFALAVVAMTWASPAQKASLRSGSIDSFRNDGWSDDDSSDDEEVIEFADVKIFFEFNGSDNDLGIQVFFDAVGWEEVEVRGPDGVVFEVENGAGLNEIGSTEVFTESAEPPLDEDNLEQAIAEFLAMFPEGEYEFEGETVDGYELEGTATLSHALPAMVELIDPEDNFPTIMWEPGLGGPPAVRYHVVAEMVVDQAGEEVVYVQATDVPVNITEITTSSEFADLAEAYELAGTLLELKVEVIAEEASGNKTITEEGIFELEE